MVLLNYQYSFVVEQIQEDSAIILTNAIYFKSIWARQFDEDATVIKCFHSRRRRCINTHMMQVVDNFGYKTFNKMAHVVELPYDVMKDLF